MPIATSNLNKKLYDLLKVKGYDPIPKDATGKTTPVPDDADVIKFTFKKDGEAMGDAWVTIDSSQNLVIYYDDDVADLDQNSSGTHADSWMGLIQHLKSWAQRRQLSFELKNKNHLTGDMAQRAHMKKEEQIEESKKGQAKKAADKKKMDEAKTLKERFGGLGAYRPSADMRVVAAWQRRKREDEVNAPERAAERDAVRMHDPNSSNTAIWDVIAKYKAQLMPDQLAHIKKIYQTIGNAGDDGSNHTKKINTVIDILRQYLVGNGVQFDRADFQSGQIKGSFGTPKPLAMEAYYPMGKKASYSDAVPQVKIVLQHTRQVEEGEQRFRNVAKIFLENEQGERILAPTTRPGIARIYARHLAEGGMPHDDRWNHVGSLVEEYTMMAGFVRATRNGQFNESAQGLVEKGVAHYQALRESLGKMTGHRGYNAYFESWAPPLMEDDGDVTNLSELFVQENLDPRIESVMPILSRLHKPITEMTEVVELAEWADSITETEEGYGDYRKGATNPDGTASAQRAADRKRDSLEYERKKKEEENKKVTEEESLTSNNPQGGPESILEDNTPLLSKEDYMAKRKALQRLQMDPEFAKNKDLVTQMMRRKAALEKEARAAGYAMAESEQVDEGRMAEASMLIYDLISGEREIYDVMNHPNSPDEVYVSEILNKLYDDVSIEHHLHPDDDFEEIEKHMVSALIDKYGEATDEDYGTPADEMYESEDSDEEPNDPTDHTGNKPVPADLEPMDEALFPDSPIGDKLRGVKSAIGQTDALKGATLSLPFAGAGASAGAALGAGASSALFAPALGAGALGGAAAALGGFLTYKGLNWLAQKLFGTKEEALEFANAHLKAAGSRQPQFEFQGKTYPVKIKSPQEAQQLLGKIRDLQSQLSEDEVNESLAHIKKLSGL